MKDKDIILKIAGRQPGATGMLEETELITEGKFYVQDGSLFLVYDESPISGLEGYKTSLEITGDMVKMERFGEQGTLSVGSMEFRKGERHMSTYETPFGAIDIELLTNEIENNITSDGLGTLNVDYHISLKGLMDTRNRLNIEIIKPS